MSLCYFVSDLHGRKDRYHKLFEEIRKEKPCLVLFGGDLLPHGHNLKIGVDRFIHGFLTENLLKLRSDLKDKYPEVLLILGNDDPRINESMIIRGEQEHKLWKYINEKWHAHADHHFFGYAIVSPTPFKLKDWEKYDIEKEMSPFHYPFEMGVYSTDLPDGFLDNTIQDDMNKVIADTIPDKPLFLFHSPPYNTNLDRIFTHRQTSGKMEVVHVGSKAIREFIETTQPPVTLHGHIHESTSITGSWKDHIGKTICFNASHEGPELSIIKFDLENPSHNMRELV